jgi:ABC-2 type transport system permease protein
VRGLRVIYRKELEDHFSSARFTLLFTVILMVSLITSYMTGTGLKRELEGIAQPSLVFLMLFTSTGALFSLTQFVAFFGPLIGMILGFDAINRERSARTLSKLLSQPIYRDAVVNAKFLAGLTVISVMFLAILLLISGMGLLTLGVVPGWEEVGRLAIYLIVSVVYVGFWLGLAILGSVLFRSMATSALATLAVWIFMAFFMALAASLAADIIAPVRPGLGYEAQAEATIKYEETRQFVGMLSPIALYSESTSVVMDPLRKTTRSLVLMGPMERISLSRFQSALPLNQSLLIVAPYLVALVALTMVCFCACYLSFMRQEVRST